MQLFTTTDACGRTIPEVNAQTLAALCAAPATKLMNTVVSDPSGNNDTCGFNLRVRAGVVLLCFQQDISTSLLLCANSDT